MDEYIKREEAIQRIRNLSLLIGFENHATAISSAVIAIERMPAMDAAEVLRNQWISVSDRLPEAVETINRNSEDEFSLSSPVLTFGKNGFAIAMVERDEHHEIFVSFDGDAIEEVAHWMPLPLPPEISEKDKS